MIRRIPKTENDVVVNVMRKPNITTKKTFAIFGWTEKEKPWSGRKLNERRRRNEAKKHTHTSIMIEYKINNK